MDDVPRGGSWRVRHRPRRWQLEALRIWSEAYRGVVEVVTGGGKTLFALECMATVRQSHPECRFLIIVPTVALLDQWHVALIEDLSVREDEIALIGGGSKRGPGTRVMIAVIDSARHVAPGLLTQGEWFLIVDECHHAASEANRRILNVDCLATLGISATPERQYDEWFTDYVVPALGPIIYRYDYGQAHAEGVIVDFDLWNVRVPLSSEEQAEIDALSQAIAKEISYLRQRGLTDSPKLRRLLLARSRRSQIVQSRIPAALSLVSHWRGQRGLIFHESIAQADSLGTALAAQGYRARVYHSGLAAPTRYTNLRLYASGQIDVLATCRALDEGIDVPESEFGIIAASTASRRQRIQRLGRVLRPAPGKPRATVATLYALPSEAERLRAEAEQLEGVASVRWFEASWLEESTI